MAEVSFKESDLLEKCFPDRLRGIVQGPLHSFAVLGLQRAVVLVFFPRFGFASLPFRWVIISLIVSKGP